jgi:hypothetical protein
VAQLKNFELEVGQLRNLLEDRDRELRESREHETILNSLLVKTSDEVGQLKSLLGDRN